MALDLEVVHLLSIVSYDHMVQKGVMIVILQTDLNISLIVALVQQKVL